MNKRIPTGGMSQGQLDINSTTPITCDSCGGMFFNEALHMRKVSGLLTGTGKPGYIPIPVFQCTKCGHVNEEFLPVEIRSSDGESK